MFSGERHLHLHGRVARSVKLLHHRHTHFVMKKQATAPLALVSWALRGLLLSLPTIFLLAQFL
jgi:hypothetical protein